MKTIMLAAAAALALGVGAAYAGEGDGESAVTAQWLAENGVRQVPATEWFAQPAQQAPQARQPAVSQGHATAFPQFPQPAGNG